MRQRMRCLLISLYVAISISTQGQTASPPHIAEFPRFRLIPGSVDADGLPTSGARFCLIKPVNDCYQMPSNTGYSSGSVMYHYGLDPISERLPLKGGGSLVFFSAQFSGGGSGALDSLAILRFESDGKIVNLLPFVGVTNQSDRAAWSIPDASSFPILVTADFVWTKGETHFARHFYRVTAYLFDIKNDRYAKAFSYQTSKKYPGLDAVSRIRVLAPEREEIMRRLQKVTF
jgi:hypothetical protein